jgi:hypothetical protein
MSPGVQKHVQQSQLPGFADAPGGQKLAANAVNVHARAFEYQDGMAIARQTSGHCPTGDTSTNDHNVTVVANGHCGPSDHFDRKAVRTVSKASPCPDALRTSV